MISVLYFGDFMRKIYRCRWDKKIGGVCGGLAQYLRCDPTIIRLLFIAVCLLTFLVPVIAYLIAWALIPLGPSTYVEIPCKKLYRSRTNRKLSGICGGLGEYFNIDPSFIRIGVIVLMFISFIFPICVSYIIGHFIIPENPG